MIFYLIIMLITAIVINYCRPHEPLFENIVLGVAWPLTVTYYTLVLLVTTGTNMLEILIPKFWKR